MLAYALQYNLKLKAKNFLICHQIHNKQKIDLTKSVPYIIIAIYLQIEGF